MLVGCDLLAKDAQSWIAVAFGDIPKELIVGAVLFDDVEAMLDRTRISDLSWDRIVLAATRIIDFRIGLQWSRLESEPGHRCKFIGSRRRYRTECSLKKPADVLGHVLRGRFDRVRTIAIVLARHPLPIGHENLIAIFGKLDVRRIPTHRDESQRAGLLGLRKIE